MFTNRILTLKGVKFVLCSDDISDEPPDLSSFLLQDSTAEHAQIWINPEDIRRLRAEFPGIQVYGFWQTLLNSKLIDFDRDAYVHEEDADAVQGVMLAIRVKRAFSTYPLFGGFPAGVTVDNRVVIDDSFLANLVLPKKAALLPDEILATERKKTRLAVVVCSCGAIGAGVLGWGADLALKALSDSRVAEGRNLDNQSMQIEASVGDILIGANPIDAAMVDRYHRIFSRLYELQAKSDLMTLKSVNLSAATEATVELRKLPTGLSFPSIATVTPGVPLSILFNLDGSGEPQSQSPPGVAP